MLSDLQQEAQPGLCCINEKVVIFIHFPVEKMKFHWSFQPGFVVVPFSTFGNKQKNEICSAMGYHGKNQSLSKKTLENSLMYPPGLRWGLPGSLCQ